jgi:hypothetical protein
VRSPVPVGPLLCGHWWVGDLGVWLTVAARTPPLPLAPPAPICLAAVEAKRLEDERIAKEEAERKAREEQQRLRNAELERLVGVSGGPAALGVGIARGSCALATPPPPVSAVDLVTCALVTDACRRLRTMCPFDGTVPRAWKPCESANRRRRRWATHESPVRVVAPLHYP